MTLYFDTTVSMRGGGFQEIKLLVVEYCDACILNTESGTAIIIMLIN